MLSLLTGPLKFVAHAVSPPSPPDTVPAKLTYHCTTPREAAQRGLELRDPPEHGWRKQA